MLLWVSEAGPIFQNQANPQWNETDDKAVIVTTGHGPLIAALSVREPLDERNKGSATKQPYLRQIGSRNIVHNNKSWFMFTETQTTNLWHKLMPIGKVAMCAPKGNVHRSHQDKTIPVIGKERRSKNAAPTMTAMHRINHQWNHGFRSQNPARRNRLRNFCHRLLAKSCLVPARSWQVSAAHCNCHCITCEASSRYWSIDGKEQARVWSRRDNSGTLKFSLTFSLRIGGFKAQWRF